MVLWLSFYELTKKVCVYIELYLSMTTQKDQSAI